MWRSSKATRLKTAKHSLNFLFEVPRNVAAPHHKDSNSSLFASFPQVDERHAGSTTSEGKYSALTDSPAARCTQDNQAAQPEVSADTLADAVACGDHVAQVPSP